MNEIPTGDSGQYYATFQYLGVTKNAKLTLSYAEAFWHFWYFFVGQTILAGGKRAENGRAG